LNYEHEHEHEHEHEQKESNNKENNKEYFMWIHTYTGVVGWLVQENYATIGLAHLGSLFVCFSSCFLF
jgi:hypothetical protein